jgi:hypothetical protein
MKKQHAIIILFFIVLFAFFKLADKVQLPVAFSDDSVINFFAFIFSLFIGIICGFGVIITFIDDEDNVDLIPFFIVMGVVLLLIIILLSVIFWDLYLCKILFIIGYSFLVTIALSHFLLMFGIIISCFFSFVTDWLKKRKDTHTRNH